MKIKWHIDTGDKCCSVEVEHDTVNEVMKDLEGAMKVIEDLANLYNQRPLKTPFLKWVKRQKRIIGGSSVRQIKIWFEVIP